MRHLSVVQLLCRKLSSFGAAVVCWLRETLSLPSGEPGTGARSARTGHQGRCRGRPFTWPGAADFRAGRGRDGAMRPRPRVPLLSRLALRLGWALLTSPGASSGFGSRCLERLLRGPHGLQPVPVALRMHRRSARRSGATPRSRTGGVSPRRRSPAVRAKPSCPRSNDVVH